MFSTLNFSGFHPRMRLNERDWRLRFASYCLKRRLSCLSQRNRPTGIMVLVILEILLGVLLLLGAVGRYERASATLESPGTFLIILAALTFCFAFGLWIGKTWAWVGAISLAALGIIFSVFILFIRPAIGQAIYLIANTVMIYFLIQPRVQRHFGQDKA